MKARGLASPDDADALALTFAQPVSIVMPETAPRATNLSARREYDPLELFERDRYDPCTTLR